MLYISTSLAIFLVIFYKGVSALYKHRYHCIKVIFQHSNEMLHDLQTVTALGKSDKHTFELEDLLRVTTREEDFTFNKFWQAKGRVTLINFRLYLNRISENTRY